MRLLCLFILRPIRGPWDLVSTLSVRKANGSVFGDEILGLSLDAVLISNQVCLPGAKADADLLFSLCRYCVPHIFCSTPVSVHRSLILHWNCMIQTLPFTLTVALESGENGVAAYRTKTNPAWKSTDNQLLIPIQGGNYDEICVLP